MNKLLFFLACIALHTHAQTSVYHSENLEIEQVSPHTYVHISYLNTDTFGRVGCNGMLVVKDGEALVFDTPADNESSEELITWVEKELHCKIKAVVATHFHADCLGGLRAFNQHKIPSYANKLTIELAKKNSRVLPQKSFSKKKVLKVADEKVEIGFFGEGHTRDNVVAYFPAEHVLFGGCLLKEINASKGNLEDANVEAWPLTIENIERAHPQIEFVIPGHGRVGDISLLDYTEDLFSK